MVLLQTICMTIPFISPVIRGERQPTTIDFVLYTQLPPEIFNISYIMKKGVYKMANPPTLGDGVLEFLIF